ncbi:hypothetical protein EIN43_03360 [Enterobacter hormaechei]|uniref:Uncharacterized protein n=1 Tax=Enterobacter hormaechei TaxID=158836 RepID=A0A4Y5ZUT5_9ENTR|nr:hypothetical protein EIN43_03360 [Enterobacter hormaechei]
MNWTLSGEPAKFRGKGLVGDEDFTRYNSVLETTRAKLAQVMESETAEGRARIEQAQAAQLQLRRAKPLSIRWRSRSQQSEKRAQNC